MFTAADGFALAVFPLILPAFISAAAWPFRRRFLFGGPVSAPVVQAMSTAGAVCLGIECLLLHRTWMAYPMLVLAAIGLIVMTGARIMDDLDREPGDRLPVRWVKPEGWTES